jgi:tRNA-dihydrouridine synthase
MPIVELARRLEDVGVAGLAIHCRTAQAGHDGRADWSWARRAREVVRIPVVVNGDVRSPDDARRALDETGCDGVMIGRAAINHPWIFRETRALLERGEHLPPPEDHERVLAYRTLLAHHVAARGERAAVAVMRRHIPMLGPRLEAALRALLCATSSLATTLDLLETACAGRR